MYILLWVKTNGAIFWVGEFTTHFSTYFSGWIGMFTGTIWTLTHGHIILRKEARANHHESPNTLHVVDVGRGAKFKL